MAETYLTLTNSVLTRLNEVELTSLQLLVLLEAFKNKLRMLLTKQYVI